MHTRELVQADVALDPYVQASVRSGQKWVFGLSATIVYL